MATPKDLIDKTLNFYDDVDATDGDNATARARLLVFLQQVNDFVHNYLEWEWTYAEAQATIAQGADNSNQLTDIGFMEFGRNGTLFVAGVQWTQKSRAIISRMRRESTSAGIHTDVFSIYDGAIQIPYVASSVITLDLFFRTAPETLLDNTDPLVLPDKYASTVLLPALVYLAQQTKNDSRDVWGAQFREGLSQMAKIEFPEKTSRRKMPLANRGW